MIATWQNYVTHVRGKWLTKGKYINEDLERVQLILNYSTDNGHTYIRTHSQRHRCNNLVELN